ncbi:hypothetical protein [Actinomycetia phage DSL-LC01]|nr:hypothetical protein [Actinomycetia phage DSL-LC01]
MYTNYYMKSKKRRKAKNRLSRTYSIQLREQIKKMLDEANSSVEPERQIPYAVALQVAGRDLRKTRKLHSDVRMFSAARAVAAHISLSVAGKETIASLENSDLLPVGHPSSTKPHAMTASALRRERARWIAADPTIKPEARALVASALSLHPKSVEAAHAFARIEAADLSVVPQWVKVLAADAAEPVTAALGLGGNSSMARRLRAQMQRRDRYGKFAFMGGGFSFGIKIGGLFRTVSGKVVGMPSGGDGDLIEVEVRGDKDLADGIYSVNSGKGTSSKAILDVDALPRATREKMKAGETDADAYDVKSLKRKDAPSELKKKSAKNGVVTYMTDDGYRVTSRDKGRDISVRREVGGSQVGTFDNFGDAMESIRKDQDNYEKYLQTPEGQAELRSGKWDVDVVGEDDVAPPEGAGEIVDLDPNGNITKQIADAVNAGSKVRFNYGGKDRVLEPQKISTAEGTGKRNLLGKDADGNTKSFTLDKIQAPAAPEAEAPEIDIPEDAIMFDPKGDVDAQLKKAVEEGKPIAFEYNGFNRVFDPAATKDGKPSYWTNPKNGNVNLVGTDRGSGEKRNFTLSKINKIEGQGAPEAPAASAPETGQPRQLPVRGEGKSLSWKTSERSGFVSANGENDDTHYLIRPGTDGGYFTVETARTKGGDERRLGPSDTLDEAKQLAQAAEDARVEADKAREFVDISDLVDEFVKMRGENGENGENAATWFKGKLNGLRSKVVVFDYKGKRRAVDIDIAGYYESKYARKNGRGAKLIGFDRESNGNREFFFTEMKPTSDAGRGEAPPPPPSAPETPAVEPSMAEKDAAEAEKAAKSIFDDIVNNPGDELPTIADVRDIVETYAEDEGLDKEQTLIDDIVSRVLDMMDDAEMARYGEDDEDRTPGPGEPTTPEELVESVAEAVFNDIRDFPGDEPMTSSDIRELVEDYSEQNGLSPAQVSQVAKRVNEMLDDAEMARYGEDDEDRTPTNPPLAPIKEYVGSGDLGQILSDLYDVNDIASDGGLLPDGTINPDEAEAITPMDEDEDSKRITMRRLNSYVQYVDSESGIKAGTKIELFDGTSVTLEAGPDGGSPVWVARDADGNVLGNPVDALGDVSTIRRAVQDNLVEGKTDPYDKYLDDLRKQAENEWENMTPSELKDWKSYMTEEGNYVGAGATSGELERMFISDYIEQNSLSREEFEKRQAAELTPEDEQIKSFLNEEFDAMFEVPEGAHKVSIFESYAPKGRTDEDSTDYTDDPAVLAQKFSREELARALADAVLPGDDGTSTGRGTLEFDAGDEAVPAEALYEALGQTGFDNDMILAGIYDSRLGPDRPQTNMEKIQQMRDDMDISPSNFKDVDDIVPADVIQTGDEAVKDAERRNRALGRPDRAARAVELTNSYDEKNEKIKSLADDLIAKQDEGLGFDAGNLPDMMREYLPLATSNDEDERAAFSGFWGMLMSLDGGSSGPGVLDDSVRRGDGFRSIVYNALLDLNDGDETAADDAYEELIEAFGGMKEFVDGKQAIADGDADLDSGSTAANFYRLVKAASRPNDRQLYRAIGVPRTDSLFTKYTTEGSVFDTDARSFTATNISKGVSSLQFIPREGEQRIIFSAAPGEVDSIEAANFSVFAGENEHFGYGTFEVVSVREVENVFSQMRGQKDIVVEIRRADKSREDSDAGTGATYTGIEDWEQIGGQLGSNEGGTYRDADGNEYYVKVARSPSHGQNEALASSFYEELGISATKVGLGFSDGDLRIVSPMIPNASADFFDKRNDPDYVNKLKEGFAVDAWLANWDVVGLGFDNVISDENGDPVRVDPGGSLLWRARGMAKGDAFGDEVVELDTFRDPDLNPNSASVFGDMTDDELRASAEKLLDITPERIDEMVDSIVTDPAEAELLKTRLKRRREYILEQYGLIPELTARPINNDGEELNRPELPDDPTDENAMREYKNALADYEIAKAVAEVWDCRGGGLTAAGTKKCTTPSVDELVEKVNADTAEVTADLKADVKEIYDDLDGFIDGILDDEGLKGSQKMRLEKIKSKMKEIYDKIQSGKISKKAAIDELNDLADSVPTGGDSSFSSDLEAIQDSIVDWRKTLDGTINDRPPSKDLPPPGSGKGYAKDGTTFLVPGMRVRTKWGYAGTVDRYDKNSWQVWVTMDIDPGGKFAPGAKKMSFSTKTLNVINQGDANEPWVDLPGTPPGKKPKGGVTYTPTKFAGPGKKIKEEAAKAAEADKKRPKGEAPSGAPEAPEAAEPSEAQEPEAQQEPETVAETPETSVSQYLPPMDGYERDEKFVDPLREIISTYSWTNEDGNVDATKKKLIEGALSSSATNTITIRNADGTDMYLHLRAGNVTVDYQGDGKAVIGAEISLFTEKVEYIENFLGGSPIPQRSKETFETNENYYDSIGITVNIDAEGKSSIEFVNTFDSDTEKHILEGFDLHMAHIGADIFVDYVKVTDESVDTLTLGRYTPEPKHRRKVNERLVGLIERIVSSGDSRFDEDALEELEETLSQFVTRDKDGDIEDVNYDVVLSDQNLVDALNETLQNLVENGEEGLFPEDTDSVYVKEIVTKPGAVVVSELKEARKSRIEKQKGRSSATGRKEVKYKKPVDFATTEIESVPSLFDTIDQVKNSENKADKSLGLGTAIDGGDIEDLEVSVSEVVEEISGEKTTRLMFKLTSWAAKKRYGDGQSLRTSDNWESVADMDAYLPFTDIDTDTGAVVEYPEKSRSAIIRDSLDVYEYTHSSGVKARVFLRQDVDGNYGRGRKTLSNTVRIDIPEGVEPTNEIMTEVFKEVGVNNPRPATKEDFDVLMENRAISILGNGFTNPEVNPTGESRKQELEKIQRTYGWSPDQFEVVRSSTGKLEVRIPEDVAKKIAKETRTKSLRHTSTLYNAIRAVYPQFSVMQLRDGSDHTPQFQVGAAFVADLLAGKNNSGGRLMSSRRRFTHGAVTTGQSSEADITEGEGGDYVYFTPTTYEGQTARGNDDAMFIEFNFDPEVMYRRIDFYANEIDNGTGAREAVSRVLDEARADNYEVMFKGAVTLDGLQSVVVSKEVRPFLIEQLEKRGVTQINGKDIRDMILYGGRGADQDTRAIEKEIAEIEEGRRNYVPSSLEAYFKDNGFSETVGVFNDAPGKSMVGAVLSQALDYSYPEKYMSDYNFTLIGVKTDGSRMIFRNSDDDSIHVVTPSIDGKDPEIDVTERDTDILITAMFESGLYTPAGQNSPITDVLTMPDSADTDADDFSLAAETLKQYYDDEDEGYSAEDYVKGMLALLLGTTKTPASPLTYHMVYLALARVDGWRDVVREIMKNEDFRID